MRYLRSTKVILGLAILVLFVLIALFGPMLAPHSAHWQASTTADTPLPPSGRFWFGTDVQQHDLFSQVLAGGRDTLLISLLAGVIATALSVLVGVTAGYLGGIVDDLLSALTNIFLALPGLLILMVVLKALPLDLTGNPLTIGAVIALTAWAWGARVLRAQTMTLRSQDYVEAAQVIGERKPRIIIFEIVPNLLPILASSFIFTVIYGIGTYATLAWLGLIGGSTVTWGTMLYNAQVGGALISGWWWWFIPPALCVAAVGVALSLLNFGIDEIINPRLTSARGTRGHRVRFVLGLTPVVRTATAAPAADLSLDLKKEVAQ
ncbi:ABC transporter permease [Streptacidiphilus sp. P02-A3a]|uniref:ABC transporter permease n=1 Tax=Streptacidiphilus sp. P02-A3a TaxID=2704468 RepID=UPI0015F9C556|nr:ABC transporter permease [Streptacidiphilus sp. P02-A3a]QMU67982.1 ABC transporter permease [Streptacidiphilus sp. P02-A3a]